MAIQLIFVYFKEITFLSLTRKNNTLIEYKKQTHVMKNETFSLLKVRKQLVLESFKIGEINILQRI